MEDIEYARCRFLFRGFRRGSEDWEAGDFNSNQGCQYTSKDFTGALIEQGIQISMDGKGRAYDNIFVERLWRSVKYEEVYLKRYETGKEAMDGLNRYLTFYNDKRLHQALGYKTPRSRYTGEQRIVQ